MATKDPRLGKTGRRKLNVTLRLPKVMVDRCDAVVENLGADYGISRGEVLRRALEIGIETIEGEIASGRAIGTKARKPSLAKVGAK